MSIAMGKAMKEGKISQEQQLRLKDVGVQVEMINQSPFAGCYLQGRRLPCRQHDSSG